MIQLYINYPNPHFTIHSNDMCAQIKKMNKDNQREINVSMQTMNQLIGDLMAGKFKFGSKKEFNDLWIEIALDSPEQEIGFATAVQTVLGLKYRPFRNALVKKHC